MSDLGSRRFLRCLVGSRSYCLEISSVRGIRNRERLQTNPNRDGPVGWLLGGDDEIPVYSTITLLGGSAEVEHIERRGRLVVVLAADPSPYGLLVDRVFPSQQVEPDRVVAMPRLAQPGLRRVFDHVVLFGDEASPLIEPNLLHPEALRGLLESADDLRDSNRPLAGSLRATDPARRKVVIARLPGADFDLDLNIGFSVRQIEEVSSPVRYSASVGASKLVLGLLPWRGRVVPLIDLYQLLNLPPVDRPVQRFAFVRSLDGDTIAFALPVNPDVVSGRIEAGTIAWPGDEQSQTWILACYKTERGLLALLDVEEISHGTGMEWLPAA